ncbi:dihydrolipoyl dehydrogenase [Anaerotignum sp. MB30-C6]|uniref:dihydrolipoyl dehydrogenase n=1 Tax=Anaerotignum sp. MB30-C6 TaxID=3070814 RepID=UPI0027DCB254|nr:dihydrolipoyl dehydrogenase [Anaerotignum sp. MB30-C6]WMI81780.1 dihydrolipoyl dehydrogenase [Anaerotignum sp. MB30-C6]
MAVEVKMPQLGLTMEEGTISKWIKNEGDTVKVGDILLEITTDKLTSEVASEAEGTLIKIVAKEGEDVPVRGILGYIGQAGEVVGGAAPAAAPVPTAAPAPKKDGKTTVAVIGGGPGGYVAAIRAAQLGGEVTLIEKNKMGGTCLNVGCIPTKVLLHSAEALAEAKEMAELGINVEVKGVDWNKVQAKKSAVTNQLVSGVTGLMKANKIKVIEGVASFASKDTLTVTKKDGSKENLTFDKIIIAAGSVPAVPPIPGVKENANCVDSTGALSFETVPKSLLVIGGGVIGIELATAYSRFGTEVTVVEAMSKLLPMMDGELTAQLRKMMEARGIKIMTDAKVQSVEAAGDATKVNVEVSGKIEAFTAEKVLVAVGRRTDTEALNMDAVGIAHDRGRISVNDKMETNVANVYAIGDCLGKVMLAHVASAQGEIAAENALGEDVLYDGATNPSCVYTDPEFAGVGLTEEKAKEMGIDFQVGKFPLMANGKSLIMNGGVGMIKFIIGKEYKEVLGVHILGPRATDLIGECALAIGMEATVEDIFATIHAHPTVTEAVREAALAAEKRAIHIPNK